MTIRQGKQIIANTQGTRNYDLLENKPKIDGVELSGEITLDDLNVQSKLSAGTGIEIVNGVISNTQTKPEWGKITGNIAEQTDLQQELAKAGTPDDITVVKTQENKLQTIGTIEKNKNLPKYDWIGTLAEYTSQNIETLHPDWVCYITDDLSGGTSVYTKNEVNELLDIKADTDLSNLSSTGQAVLDAKQDIATAVNYDNITNCITGISQDIRLELNNGVLTLKAGSKVYIPNGFEDDGVTKKFDEVVIEEDKIFSSSSTTSYESFFGWGDNKNVFWFNGDSLIFSSSTTPSSTTDNAIWYDTGNNIIKKMSNGSWIETRNSLPLGRFTRESGVPTKINQIFNGFGYIGSTVFVLPNVKGLIPNGRNEDGSLKNIEFNVSKVLSYTYSSTSTFTNLTFGIRQSEVLTSYTTYKYDQINNYNTNNDGRWDVLTYATGNVTAGIITSFTPKLSFCTVDRNDSSWLSSLGMPSNKYIDLTLGANEATYTAPANGWVALRKKATASGQYMAVGLNISNFNNSCFATASGQALSVITPVSKNAKIYVAYNLGGETLSFKFYYAEGEE